MDETSVTLASIFGAIDWSALGTILAGVLGTGGLAVLLGKWADKRWTSADARLADAGSIRKERQDRLEQLEDENRELRTELHTMTIRYLDAENRLIASQKALIKQDITSDLVRRNIEHPALALVPVVPEDEDDT